METYVICNTCKRKYSDKIEQDWIIQTGECLGCDHVRGEVLETQIIEAEEAQQYEQQY